MVAAVSEWDRPGEDGDPRTMAEIMFDHAGWVDEIVKTITPQDTERAIRRIRRRIHDE